jgi:hypothetical protein
VHGAYKKSPSFRQGQSAEGPLCIERRHLNHNCTNNLAPEELTVLDTLVGPSWGTSCPDASFGAFAHWGPTHMATNEYRHHAAECLSIADDITISPKSRLVLLAMAQTWLKLAQRVEANADADVDNQPASPSITP